MDRATKSELPPSRGDWRSAFIEARDALFRDDVARARPVLDSLEAAFPCDVSIRLHAAWARLRTDANVTTARKREIEELARRAFASGECTALPLCIAGHAALRRGKLESARRLFARAARADDTLLDARRGVLLVERRIARAAASLARPRWGQAVVSIAGWADAAKRAPVENAFAARVQELRIVDRQGPRHAD